ncbi:Mis12-Mtw1 protein family-domain-containing protein [Umbelopsis sp. PMI_123]|nr:Mis12-Mtw1 protein family-domain-containing protein [Umbelopsis sp. PMI_123]
MEEQQIFVDEVDDEGFTYRKSKKFVAQEPSPVIPRRKSVFSSISPTALRNIEQVVARGPPGKERIRDIPVKTSTGPTTPPLKRPIETDVAIPSAKKQAVRANKGYTVPIYDRGPTLHRRSGSKSSWISSKVRPSSFSTNSFLDQPPSNINPSEYYLHTPSKLPEPLRMLQLLAWCARTVTDKQWKLGRENIMDSKATTTATRIQDALIMRLLNGQINTSWYRRPLTQQDGDTDSILSPNPINIQNAKTLKKWSSIIENFEAEDQTWNRTATKYSVMHVKALDTYPQIEDNRQITTKWHNTWIEALSPIEQQFLNHHCKPDDDGQVLDLMDKAIEDLQTKVDLIEQTTNNAVADMKRMDTTADDILKSLSFTLTHRQHYASHLDMYHQKRYPVSPDPSLLLRMISGEK